MAPEGAEGRAAAPMADDAAAAKRQRTGAEAAAGTGCDADAPAREPTPAEQLAAAKRRALDEAKRLALEHAADAAADRQAAAAAVRDAGACGDADGSDSESEDIVTFLRNESEAVAGSVLADGGRGSAGLVVTKEAVYKRRDPREEKATAIVVRGEDDGKIGNEKVLAGLPQGSHVVNSNKGAFAWAGQAGAGGVRFPRRQPQPQDAAVQFPPPPSAATQVAPPMLTPTFKGAAGWTQVKGWQAQ